MSGKISLLEETRTVEANLEALQLEIGSHRASICDACILDRSLRTNKCAELRKLEEAKQVAYRRLKELYKRIEQVPKMGFWSTDIGAYGIKEGPARVEVQARAEVEQHIAALSEKELEAVLAYMESSSRAIAYMGYASCRLCGRVNPETNRLEGLLGTSDMLTPDEQWVFPEKWQHYIIEHKVRPFPEKFTEDAIEWYRERTREQNKVAESTSLPN